MKRNRYSIKFENKSISELEAIANNAETFEEEARLAAFWILEERNALTNETKEVEENINLKRQEKIQRGQERDEDGQNRKLLQNDLSPTKIKFRRRVVDFLFYASIVLIPLGVFLRVQASNGGSFLLFLGLLGLATYFTIKFIKDISKKRSNWTIALMQIILVLMSITLFSRYLYHAFWDYPGIIVTPLFILLSVRYFLVRIKDFKITVTSVLFVVLSIPLFGLKFNKSPRHLIPQEWYVGLGAVTFVRSSLPLPWEVQTEQAKKLTEQADKFNSINSFDDAITIYKQSLKVEYNPATLFHLSIVLASSNRFEEAISYMDTVIEIDSTFVLSYVNRGLFYYKIQDNDNAISDCLKAIEMDSNESTAHYNLALAYYAEEEYEKSCKEINIVAAIDTNALNDNYIQMVIRDIGCQISVSTSNNNVVKDEIKTKTDSVYRKNGILEYSAEMKNNKKDGVVKLYDTLGNVSMFCIYKNDELYYRLHYKNDSLSDEEGSPFWIYYKNDTVKKGELYMRQLKMMPSPLYSKVQVLSGEKGGEYSDTAFYLSGDKVFLKHLPESDGVNNFTNKVVLLDSKVPFMKGAKGAKVGVSYEVQSSVFVR